MKRLTDILKGKAPLSARRSSQWRKVRRDFLLFNPCCAACGSYRFIEAHHIVPFHVRPDLELEPSNLITLCSKHHLIFGHLGNFKWWNENVREDAKAWAAKIVDFIINHPGRKHKSD